MVEIKARFDEETATVSYLIWDAASRVGAIIDPVLNYDAAAGAVSHHSADTLLEDAKREGVRLKYVLETHVHADHMTAADYIRLKTGAQIGIGEKITEIQAVFAPLFQAEDVAADGRAFDLLFKDNDTIQLGETTITALHTPGHTPACVSYLVDDAVFVGDAVFMPDFGSARTDFPGGDAAALYQSVRRILELPKGTRVFVGHDYPPKERGAPAWEATVAQHRSENIHMHDGISEAEFVSLRKVRDATLTPPKLILPSLQVNIRAGALPPPEKDGCVYLKIPVNRL